ARRWAAASPSRWWRAAARGSARRFSRRRATARRRSSSSNRSFTIGKASALTPDAMTPQAERRAALQGCALPDSGKARAVAAPFATRFVLRGGPDVAGPVGAAFGATPPMQPLRAAGEGSRAALWMGPDE